MDHDVLIIGGGPAGATAAFLLARAGWKVLVVEKAKFPRRKVCGEFISAGTLSLLDKLGFAGELRGIWGPEIRRVGLFAGPAAITSPMPRYESEPAWGRASGREHLDTILLEQAGTAGADVLQPASVVSLERASHGWRAELKEAQKVSTRAARIVIAAHGSWDSSRLSTFPVRTAPRSTDLFGFKAHFRNTSLPEALMPLLAFAGGYGGMVHTDNGRVSFSCCIQRRQLDQIRIRGQGAGESVIDYITEKCAGVRGALASATLDGPWLAVGPIRPGIRQKSVPGLFLLGNAAGEAHPVIAEGISMAVQSAWLLCRRLADAGPAIANSAALQQLGESFVGDWRRNFSSRIRLSRFVARLAMSRTAPLILLPLFRTYPSLLTFGAQRCGKVQAPRSSAVLRPVSCGKLA
jgi:2-polyprenyl-6-methoxyphenol hydroxylase-like FAD-dependent oxidoreductase